MCFSIKDKWKKRWTEVHLGFTGVYKMMKVVKIFYKAFETETINRESAVAPGSLAGVSQLVVV